jgi:hypothetical protein
VAVQGARTCHRCDEVGIAAAAAAMGGWKMQVDHQCGEVGTATDLEEEEGRRWCEPGMASVAAGAEVE